MQRNFFKYLNNRLCSHNHIPIRKFHNPILKKWGEYWKNLYKDYKEVAIDINNHIIQNKIQSFALFAGFCSLAYCVHNNPDEISFRNQLLAYSNQLGLVGAPIRNPITLKHLQDLEQNYNAGLIRIMNLGLFSLIWIDNYDSNCGIYESQCKYLKPSILTFHHRILDVGILGRWLLLDYKMIDFDINHSE